MPDLDSPMHVQMLEEAVASGKIGSDGVYGMHWGDPQTDPVLKEVRNRFVLPYVHPDRKAVEIGPGGGRWTRYLLGFEEIIAVDYNQPLLDKLAETYRVPYLRPRKNSGTDFPGVESKSIDFVFSFGVFVHLAPEVIQAYFNEIKRVLKTDGCAVIQYSDKRKARAQELGEGFTDTTPDVIRGWLRDRGLKILEEDTESLWHSAVVRFGI